MGWWLGVDVSARRTERRASTVPAFWGPQAGNCRGFVSLDDTTKRLTIHGCDVALPPHGALWPTGQQLRVKRDVHVERCQRLERPLRWCSRQRKLRGCLSTTRPDDCCTRQRPCCCTHRRRGGPTPRRSAVASPTSKPRRRPSRTRWLARTPSCRDCCEGRSFIARIAPAIDHKEFLLRGPPTWNRPSFWPVCRRRPALVLPMGLLSGPRRTG